MLADALMSFIRRSHGLRGYGAVLSLDNLRSAVVLMILELDQKLSRLICETYITYIAAKRPESAFG
jgi:hypothetical protein